MDRIETFQEFLSTQGSEISMWGFVLNLGMAAFLAYVLSWIYVRYGNTLSNRNLFAKNFIVMAMTTMFIIPYYSYRTWVRRRSKVNYCCSIYCYRKYYLDKKFFIQERSRSKSAFNDFKRY